MFIGKVSKQVFSLKERREFYDVEADQIDPKVLGRISDSMQNWAEVQDYLRRVHDTLRQTGAASIANVEVPKCLLEVASKPTSTSGSRKKKSSSSTKPKPSNSGSQSSEDTSA